MKFELKVYEVEEDGGLRETKDSLQDMVENYGYSDFYPKEARKDYLYEDPETRELKKFKLEEEPAGIGALSITVAVKTQEDFILGYGFYKTH